MPSARARPGGADGRARRGGALRPLCRRRSTAPRSRSIARCATAPTLAGPTDRQADQRRRCRSSSRKTCAMRSWCWRSAGVHPGGGFLRYPPSMYAAMVAR
jgi:hypothetical protein